MSGSRRRHTLAVALHDIEPATFERCALIRDWLDDHGVGRVTLLVIPARDLHPLAERSPEMVQWLIERERGGDAIAQHGFQHLRSQRASRWAGGPYQSLRTIGADRETEFVGLDAQETRRAVDAGRRVLKLAGIEPRGFVAPGYAYTPALRQALSERFHWWTALLGLHRAQPGMSRVAIEDEQRVSRIDPQAEHGRSREGERSMSRELLGPPIALSSAGRLRRSLSPALLRAGALASGTTLRLDLHPSDLDHPSHMLALEWVLKRSASRREAVTYEQLAQSTLTGSAVVAPLKAPSSAASSGTRARWAGRP
jgi:predicted deacetylase